MTPGDLLQLLASVERGETSPATVAGRLATLPFETSAIRA